MWNTRSARLAATAVVAALALAACGGDGDGGGPQAPAQGHAFNAALDSIILPTTTPTGGTLKLGSVQDADSWDPARAYFGFAWNMQRLYARKLVDFKPNPQQSSELDPDLATTLGQASPDFKTFTYTLKDGIKYDDGTAVTSQDVKYAIQRAFAVDIITGGPTQYLHPLLDQGAFDTGTPDYKGPYAEPTEELMVGGAPAIETPDDKTIIFHLTQPYASFDFLMAMGPASPIPQARDTGETYANGGPAIAASGPFKIETYDRDTGITFVRNDQWDQATDTIRHPLVDRVEVTYNENPDDLDQQLKAGTLHALMHGDVQPTFQAEALADPTLKNGVDNAPDGSLSYLTVFSFVEPLDDINCRKAIFQAIDKVSYLAAMGGTNNGVVSTSLTPPPNPGADEGMSKDLISNGADHTGDVAAAQQSLAACGEAGGFELNLGFVNQGTGPDRAAAVQEALGRAGINVTLKPGEAETYYSNYIGSHQSIADNQIGLAFAGWGADFPTTNGFWYSLAHTKADTSNAQNPGGSDSNYVDLEDPTVTGLLDQALAAPQDQWATIGGQLDDAIMNAAVYVPMNWGKSFTYRSPKLVNYYATQFFNIGDWVNVGVTP